ARGLHGDRAAVADGVVATPARDADPLRRAARGFVGSRGRRQRHGDAAVVENRVVSGAGVDRGRRLRAREADARAGQDADGVVAGPGDHALGLAAAAHDRVAVRAARRHARRLRRSHLGQRQQGDYEESTATKAAAFDTIELKRRSPLASLPPRHRSSRTGVPRGTSSGHTNPKSWPSTLVVHFHDIGIPERCAHAAAASTGKVGFALQETRRYLYPARCGSATTSEGTKISNTSTATSAAMKGASSRTMSFTEAPERPDSTNSRTPYGGVSRPIIMFTTMTTPKCTRSTPSALAAGRSSGTSTRSSVVVSSRQPSTRNTRFATTMKPSGPIWSEANHAATRSGICSVAST